jgi:hypothetical protein
MNHAINPFLRFSMNSLFLLIGILGIAIGFFAYYASVHDKVNALGRYTKPAIAFIILCAVLLVAFALIS